MKELIIVICIILLFSCSIKLMIAPKACLLMERKWKATDMDEWIDIIYSYTDWDIKEGRIDEPPYKLDNIELITLAINSKLFGHSPLKNPDRLIFDMFIASEILYDEGLISEKISTESVEKMILRINEVVNARPHIWY